MIDYSKAYNGNFVRLDVSGKLTHADYEDLLPRLEQDIEAQGPLRMLIVLDDFEGWTAGALVDDVKFDIRHGRDLERVAVVGENKLEEWGTELSDRFFPGEVAFFKPGQMADAEAWATA